MKKILLLAVAFASFATVTSCDKDDDQAALEGKWEFSKEGAVVSGQEILLDYTHEEGCAKDFVMINATTVTDHSFFGATCDEAVDSYTYTRSGNTITSTEGGETITSEIKTLNGSTLKLYADIEGVTYVTVFTRK